MRIPTFDQLRQGGVSTVIDRAALLRAQAGMLQVPHIIYSLPFGSALTGDTGTYSDIDYFIIYDPAHFREVFSCVQDITNTVGVLFGIPIECVFVTPKVATTAHTLDRSMVESLIEYDKHYGDEFRIGSFDITQIRRGVTGLPNKVLIDYVSHRFAKITKEYARIEILSDQAVCELLGICFRFFSHYQRKYLFARYGIVVLSHQDIERNRHYIACECGSYLNGIQSCIVHYERTLVERSFMMGREEYMALVFESIHRVVPLILSVCSNNFS